MSGTTYQVNVASDSPWMSCKEAAAYIGVSTKRIRQLAKEGWLPHAQLHPGAWRLYRREDLDGLMAQHYRNGKEA